MARKSKAALSAVTTIAPTHLQPIDSLNDAEKALWRSVVNSKPSDWFGNDSAPLLAEYVRAAVSCDWLDEQIKHAQKIGEVDRAISLLKERDRESKRVASLGTKLRLTQQSRYTPKAASTANKKAGGSRPWQS